MLYLEMGGASRSFMVGKNQIIPILLADFPEFQSRWDKHVQSWKGEPAGDYIDMAEFVTFVMEDLYEKSDLERLRSAFQEMEGFLKNGDKEVRDLVTLGFLETLQCAASWKPYGNQAFVPFLGAFSAEAWKELKVIWKGKSSLADVIRAERSNKRRSSRFASLFRNLRKVFRL